MLWHVDYSAQEIQFNCTFSIVKKNSKTPRFTWAQNRKIGQNYTFQFSLLYVVIHTPNSSKLLSIISKLDLSDFYQFFIYYLQDLVVQLKAHHLQQPPYQLHPLHKKMEVLQANQIIPNSSNNCTSSNNNNNASWCPNYLSLILTQTHHPPIIQTSHWNLHQLFKLQWQQSIHVKM